VNRRPSRQTVAVLTALAASPATWRYGYELGQEVGLKAGSLYPILMRLGDRGWLEHTWEAGPPAGRPPRHLYRLTADGVRLAAEVVRAPAQVGSPASRQPGGSRPGKLQGASESRATSELRGGSELREAW
jgi:PadR family transcriptional regulator, regulatory protein PadR